MPLFAMICSISGVHVFYILPGIAFCTDEHMQASLLIGIAASVFTGISMLPQLIKMVKEKKADDISYGMLIVLMIGLGLFCWYGTLKKDWIIVASNSFSLAVNLSVLILSIRYKKQNN